jgi:hypothetical protein
MFHFSIQVSKIETNPKPEETRTCNACRPRRYCKTNADHTTRDTIFQMVGQIHHVIANVLHRVNHFCILRQNTLQVLPKSLMCSFVKGIQMFVNVIDVRIGFGIAIFDLRFQRLYFLAGFLLCFANIFDLTLQCIHTIVNVVHGKIGSAQH